MRAGLTDVRVCHQRPGDVIIMLTFLSSEERDKFRADVEPRIVDTMKDVCRNEDTNPEGPCSMMAAASCPRATPSAPSSPT